MGWYSWRLNLITTRIDDRRPQKKHIQDAHEQNALSGNEKLLSKEYRVGGAIDWCLPDANERCQFTYSVVIAEKWEFFRLPLVIDAGGMKLPKLDETTADYTRNGLTMSQINLSTESYIPFSLSKFEVSASNESTSSSMSSSMSCFVSCYNLYVRLEGPKPSSRPHKSRECLPLVLILRNSLKYAFTYRETTYNLLEVRKLLIESGMKDIH
ncbi:40S ribosomal protein S4, partial [Tanacetum coccineum]